MKKKWGRHNAASEVDLEGELAEAPFVVRTVVVADTSFGRRDGHGNTVADVRNIIQAFLDKEIVMVEKVEAFSAELKVEPLVNGEGLADGGVEGPGARSAEAVAGNHGRWERTPVRDTLRRRHCQRGISEGDGRRNIADDIAVRSSAVLTARD